MTKPNLSREYLLSDEYLREFERMVERSLARTEERREALERRRRRLNRLSLGLLGRSSPA
jgi:hypothetical protein